VIVFVLRAIVGMAVLIFAFENQEPVALRYLYTWQTPPILCLRSLWLLWGWVRDRQLVWPGGIPA
jgi:uncharacterized integral membrane protein